MGDAHYGLDDLPGLPGHLDKEREETEAGTTSITTLGVTHAPTNEFSTPSRTTVLRSSLPDTPTAARCVCLAGEHSPPTAISRPRWPLESMSGLTRAKRPTSKCPLVLGTSIYAPVRLFCPPEAVLVTLVADDIGYA